MIVHPDLVEDTVSMLCVDFVGYVNTLKSGNWDRVDLNNGGRLIITHMESIDYRMRRYWHDHAGMQYTSIMFDIGWAGNCNDLRPIEGCKNGEVSDCIMYMMTRLQSKSKYSSKFVIM